MRTLTAFDVDTEALADTFERMADGLRSNDVLIDRLQTQSIAEVDDMADFRFEMAYHATHGFVDVTDVIEYDVDHYLRFADEYVDPILQGDKWATVRVGFERDVEVGDVVDLIDEDDDKFAEATVVSIRTEPLTQIAENLKGISASSLSELTGLLNEHYPGEITPETTATVFRFRDVDPDAGYLSELWGMTPKEFFDGMGAGE